MKYKNFGFISSKIKKTIEEEKFLINLGCIQIENIEDIKKNNIDFLFVLGGDGFMLRVLHKFINQNLTYYGINCGTLGFLLNKYKNVKNHTLEYIVKNSKKYTINPLKAKITNNKNEIEEIYAINEIALMRTTHAASHIKIFIEEKERLSKLICDGVIVSTPAGSTAYNLSLNGPILPLSTGLLAITPISPFHPRLWRGAIVRDIKKIEFEVLDYNLRTINTTADFIEFQNTKKVEIEVDKTKEIKLLFNKKENIEEKILNQQFN